MRVLNIPSGAPSLAPQTHILTELSGSPRMSPPPGPPSQSPGQIPRHCAFLTLPPTACPSPAPLCYDPTISIPMAPAQASSLPLEPCPNLSASGPSQSCPSPLPSPKVSPGPGSLSSQLNLPARLHSIYPMTSNSLATPHYSLPQCLCIFSSLCRDSQRNLFYMQIYPWPSPAQGPSRAPQHPRQWFPNLF